MDYVDGEPLFNISLSTEKWQQVIEQVKKYFQCFIVPIYSLVISVAVRLCLNEIHNGELKVELVGFNRGEEDLGAPEPILPYNVRSVLGKQGWNLARIPARGYGAPSYMFTASMSFEIAIGDNNSWSKLD
ncbi:20871_t:CDS:2 [Entrophospora sp. SA101]|nr:1779_t:CDS:2 [Entrophospora sp. SA101]CAJ0745782.1 20412_t:CDS:2 [Entrophospora sp. SA101]CAJ0758044.1 20871_t:CDS:2 [Entrophospora sp. SA101]CAJ0838477.1 13501_t:CDS:2 [Entrophospora sp. SA101]CAJ0840960.1 13465_t:CDS:2 [Entrophospora sp. SA101]